MYNIGHELNKLAINLSYYILFVVVIHMRVCVCVPNKIYNVITAIASSGV